MLQLRRQGQTARAVRDGARPVRRLRRALQSMWVGSLPRLWIDQLQGMCSGRTRGYGADGGESAGARQPHSANRAHRAGRGHRRHRDRDFDRDVCLCCSRKSRARGRRGAASRLGLQQLWHARYQGRAVSPKTHPVLELHDSLSDLWARVVHDVRPVPLPGVRLNCRNSRHRLRFPQVTLLPRVNTVLLGPGVGSHDNRSVRANHSARERPGFTLVNPQHPCWRDVCFDFDVLNQRTGMDEGRLREFEDWALSERSQLSDSENVLLDAIAEACLAVRLAWQDQESRRG